MPRRRVMCGVSHHIQNLLLLFSVVVVVVVSFFTPKDRVPRSIVHLKK